MVEFRECILETEVWIDLWYHLSISKGEMDRFWLYVAWYGLHWKLKFGKDVWDAKCCVSRNESAYAGAYLWGKYV